MNDHDPTALLAELRALTHTLTDAQPYAAQLGGWMAADSPAQSRAFAAAHPYLAAVGLAQARDFAFLTFAKSRPAWLARVDAHISGYLREGQRHLISELVNTVAWYHRHG